MVTESPPVRWSGRQYRINRVRAVISGPVILFFIGMFAILVNCYAEQITGWVERVYIYPERFPVFAKIDTGAENSSLHARDVTHFQREGREWVKFELTNRESNAIVIEKPVVHRARIKRHHKLYQLRPTIKLELCLGGIRKMVDVNLVDRTGFEHKLLVGRSFLSKEFYVDPSRSDLASRDCA